MTFPRFAQVRAAAPRLLVGAACAVAALFAHASDTLTMASTTSTQQSGLFGHLLPAYKKATGVDIKVVAVGTGQALDMGRRGDADILFVHDRKSEEQFVAEGHGVKRHSVMYNDFVVIGPKSDPLHIRGQDVVEAFKKIAAGHGAFISRGDKSGTYSAEKRFWAMAGLADQQGRGYKPCGCGMGPALNIASSSNAYVLADRGTWLNFKNRGELAVLVEGDQRLFNQYGVIAVNPARHAHVKVQLAQQFIAWVTSPAGQKTIANYKIGGQQLFFPNAGH